ncbi:MAG: hypothetical protein ACM3X4_09805 [Ignavibacteriales bacterium]
MKLPRSTRKEKRVSLLSDEIAKPPTTLNVSAQEVKDYFTAFSTSLESVPVQEKKCLTWTFVRRLKLPDKKEVKVSFYPDLTACCLGVGSGTWAEMYHQIPVS